MYQESARIRVCVVPCVFLISERLRCQYSSDVVVVAVVCRTTVRLVGLASKVVMQYDRDFVGIILLYQGRYTQNFT
jgi:hypothetical protein